MTRRALVFAHFDPHGIVDPHVLHALRCYRQHFEVIHFVSTAALTRSQQGYAAALADRVIVRDNVGYDFLSWRAGFEAIPQPRAFDQIVFANDSCYGPITDLAALWASAAEAPGDLWGASLNRQFRPHVQSFFMVFGRALIRSGFVRCFWHSVETLPDKMQTILRYEVGLSQQAEDAGFTIGALVDVSSPDGETRRRVVADTLSLTDPVRSAAGLRAVANEPYPNPVQNYALEAIRRGMPFVKVELLRDNPLRANLARLHAAMAGSRLYDVSLVRQHLSRLGPCGPFPPRPERTNAGLVEAAWSWCR